MNVFLKALATTTVLGVTSAIVIPTIAQTNPSELRLRAEEDAPPLDVVETPATIGAVEQNITRFKPELSIASPQPNQVLETGAVELQLQVRRLPVAYDPDTGLGAHVKVIVDNNEPIDYFNVNEPLVLQLAPGTHTIRTIAASPWDSSYRGLDAFDSVTFHVEEADGRNNPTIQVGSPLLTVTSPSGSYGSDPILLDYIVDGVNLGAAKIRYTVNGISAETTSRMPMYLEGWLPGENQLVVELVGPDGTVLDNNGTGINRIERTIFLDAQQVDGLSQLVDGAFQPSDLRNALGPNPFVYDDRGNPRLL
ncbi:MAG: hypothetical protein AAGA40_15835 [Cyanobacteria bacterium P01_E01_bin.45]